MHLTLVVGNIAVVEEDLREDSRVTEDCGQSVSNNWEVANKQQAFAKSSLIWILDLRH